MKKIILILFAFAFPILLSTCTKKENNQKPELLINSVLSSEQFHKLLDASMSISDLVTYTHCDSINCNNSVLHEGESVQLKAEVYVKGIFQAERRFIMREMTDSTTGARIYLEIKVPSIIKYINTKSDSLTPVETNDAILERLLTKIRDSTFVFKTVAIGIIRSQDTIQNNICSKKLYVVATDLYLPD